MKTDVRSKIDYILKTGLVREYEDYLITVIPELQCMVDFDHNHPSHHLNVWEHTKLVLDNLETDDLETNMAALLHDIGKPYSYQEDIIRHFKGHEEVSTNMAFLILQRLKYDASFIENVCYLVETHDSLINPDHLDNTNEMIEKRLLLQYADALAHHPNKIVNRLNKLNKVKEKLKTRTR